MHQIFSPAVLQTNNISCSRCNWKGKGEEVSQEELFLTDAIEIYCPSCNGYLGFISTADDGMTERGTRG